MADLATFKLGLLAMASLMASLTSMRFVEPLTNLRRNAASLFKDGSSGTGAKEPIAGESGTRDGVDANAHIGFIEEKSRKKSNLEFVKI